MARKKQSQSRKKYVTVKPGWSLEDVALAGGHNKPRAITTWSIITVLNGHDNWIKFNSSLTPGKKVRVK